MVTVTELGKNNRTAVVSASGTGLTGFDPILNDPGARPTLTVRSGNVGATATVRTGADIRATQRRAVRVEGEEGVALPRRNYAPQ